MSKSGDKQRHRSTSTEESVRSTGEVRIDSPHQTARDKASLQHQPEPAHAPLMAVATQAQLAARVVGIPTPTQPPSATEPASLTPPIETAVERAQKQAEQLANHLRSRLKELDHREAQLNARIAAYENDMRTARLWLSERQAELDAQAEQLRVREKELSERLDRLAAATAEAEKEVQTARQASKAAEAAAAELRFKQQRIDARREASVQLVRQLMAGVERRRQSLEVQEAQWQERIELARKELRQREEALHEASRQLDARCKHIEQTEARLTLVDGELKRLREELKAEREQLYQEIRLERERLQAEQAQTQAELQRKREALQKQSQKLDECRAGMEQMRSELLSLHRETLEIRLATEELWVQLSGAAPPAALTRSLGRIRSKLADQYRLAVAELQREKAELESVRSQLAAQYQKLEERRKHFEQWAAQQQEALQQQANLLIAREQEIRRQEVQLRDSARLWESERLDYQRQILRLQAQLAGQSTTKTPDFDLVCATA